jgi:hypothetical protein
MTPEEAAKILKKNREARKGNRLPSKDVLKEYLRQMQAELRKNKDKK